MRFRLREITQNAAPGNYPDPSDTSGKTLRRWDGAAWDTQTADTRCMGAADLVAKGATPASERRWHRSLAVFRRRWLQALAACWALSMLAAGAFTATHNRVAYAFAIALGALGGALGFGIFVAGRLRLGQVLSPLGAGLVAVIGGGAAAAAAIAIERAAGPHLNGYLVGLIEETAILAVPIGICAIAPRRFLNPRAGLALAVASSAGFAAWESAIDATAITYKLHEPFLKAIGFDLHQSLLGSFLHISMTGLIAAVAWRVWYSRNGIVVTGSIAAAYLAGVGQHTANDFIARAGTTRPWLAPLTLLTLAGSYLAFRWAASALTPPDAVAGVPKGWRPARFISTPAASAARDAAQRIGPEAQQPLAARRRTAA